MNSNICIYKSGNRLRIISSTVVLASLMSGCMSLTNSSDISESTNETYITESSITETEQSTITTSESTTESTEHSIETIQYSCPVEYNADLAASFRDYLNNKYGTVYIDDVSSLGFDNRYLDESLHEFLADRYGISDPSLSIHNFHYLQFTGFRFAGHPLDNPSELMANISKFRLNTCLSRAVLSSQNLQYFVDEVPASYFEERFPEFMDNYGDSNFRNQCFERVKYLVTNVIDRNDFTLDDINNLDSYDYDLLLFANLIEYNRNRNTLMYFSMTSTDIADIKQVRDESTGRNLLFLNDSQRSRLENIMNNYEGFDFSITEPESREHFYQTYGVYPEELINPDRVYESNKTSSRSR